MDEAQKTIPPILLALFVAIVPHLFFLPVWVVAWCGFMWGFVLVCIRYNRPLPGRTIRNALAFAGIIGVLLTYHARIDAGAYVSLLAVMAAIKPFEISGHRDRMIVLFLAYFIVITSLLESETLWITLYMFVSVLVTTAVLVRVNDPAGRFREHFRVSAVILAQAFPLMLVLFFLFPRVEGGMVGITRSDTGISGFTSALNPGAVSRLAEDDSVAFRVAFEDDIPDFPDLYWRGIVFSRFDGSAWQRRRQLSRAPDTEEKSGIRKNYEVMLEPHGSRWMFALDFPSKIPETGVLYEDFTMVFDAPVHRAKRYSAASRIRKYSGPTSPPSEAYLRLPGSGNPRTRKLGARFAGESGNAGDIADRVLKHMRRQEFSYTLDPPALGKNPVDDFLFESQSGYCEHYASAFAFLMRSAGVPARVVGGYLGGDYNPFGDYLIVRQSHAHAWVEVWEPGRGWLRMDPTEAVAPERISSGVRGAFSAGEPGGIAQRYLRPVSELFRQVQLGLDAVSINWETWFTGYSFEQQKTILERLGIPHSRRSGFAVLLAASLVLVFLLFGAYVFGHLRGKAEKPDRAARLYDVFLGKLLRAKVKKHHWEGPLEFAERAVRLRPELEKEIREITALYVDIRYSRAPLDGLSQRLETAVKRFRPGKKAVFRFK